MTKNTTTDIREFAARYTAAWCSHDAAGVAAFFSPDGSQRDNGGPLLIGRNAIAESARSFMDTFPDLRLFLVDIAEDDGKILYKWRLDGTHCSTGRHVLIDGAEEWRMGDDGLVAESIGRFDVADFNKQAGL